jgi:hypothetical protein
MAAVQTAELMTPEQNYFIGTSDVLVLRET